MVMIEGRDYTSQEVYFYNQGTQRGRDLALIHYQQRTGQRPSPELEQRIYGGTGGTTPLTPIKGTQTIAVQSGVKPLKPLTPIEQQLMKSNPRLAEKLYEQRTKQTLQNIDLKSLISKPMAPGSYQTEPGGEIKIASPEQQARLLAEKQIKPTSYYETWGYKPSDSGYSQEIAEVSSQLSTQQQQLAQVQSAQAGSSFKIGDKTYTKEEAVTYFNKNIQDLTQSKASLERYRETGWELKKTDTGYEFQYPKASDVVTKVYGGERPDLYVARELGSTLGFGTLIIGAQQLITGQKSLEARKEQLAEQILGATRKPGETIEAHAQRFWTSEQAIMDVYLPLATIGISEAIAVGGKTVLAGGKTLVSAVRFTETGQKVFGGVGRIGGQLISKIPTGAVETAKYVGFRAGFAGKTVLYETGQLMAKPGMGIASNVGLYTAMSAPQLAQVAQERPEMFGAVLGESLFKYQIGMGAMDYGFQKPVTTSVKRILAREQPLIPTAGFKKFVKAESATQPLPGAKRFTTKGMTAEERFAFEYKQPAQRITAEEREAESLARSLDKKKPSQWQKFIRSEEGTQPILPGSSRFTEKKEAQDLIGSGKSDLIKPKVVVKKVESPWAKSAEQDWMFKAKQGTLEQYGLKTTDKRPSLESEVHTPGVHYGSSKQVQSPWDTFTNKQITVEKFGGGEELPQGSMYRYFKRDYAPSEPRPKLEKIFPEKTKAGEQRITTHYVSVDKLGAPHKFERAFWETSEKQTPIAIERYGKTQPETPYTWSESYWKMPKLEKQPLKEFKSIDLMGLSSKPIAEKPYDLIKPGLSAKQVESPWAKSITQDSLLSTKPGSLGSYGVKITRKRPALESEVHTPGVHYGSSKQVQSPWDTFTNKQITVEKFGGGEELPQGSMYRYFKRDYAPSEPRPKLEKIFPEKTKAGQPITKAKVVIGEKGVTFEDMFKSRQIKGGKREPVIKDITKSTEGETSGGQVLILEKPKMLKKTESALKEKTVPIQEAELPAGLTTIERPLTREELKILSVSEKDTGRISSYWSGKRPGIGKGATQEPLSTEIFDTGYHLLTLGREGKSEGGGLLSAMESNLINKKGSNRLEMFISGEKELTKPEQKRPRLSDFYQGSKLSELNESDFMQKREQGMDDLQILKQDVEQVSEQDTFYDTITDTLTDKTWRPPPPRKKTEEPDKPEYIREKMKENVAYDVYVKARGMYHGKVTKPVKFIKVTRQPVSYEDALSLGGEITDTSSAVSFRLKQVKQRPTRLDRPVQNFTTRAYKFRKQGETFIEKSPYRMDSPGELQQVSALGQQERRRQGLMSKSSSIFSIRTPRSRATGLLSPMTKLKETRLFKKKKSKGERKNAYI